MDKRLFKHASKGEQDHKHAKSLSLSLSLPLNEPIVLRVDLVVW